MALALLIAGSSSYMEGKVLCCSFGLLFHGGISYVQLTFESRLLVPVLNIEGGNSLFQS